MRTLLSITLLVATAAPASAQLYRPRPAQTYEAPAVPQTKRTYDWQSGNSYTTTVRPDGSARVQGYNMQNGSMWNSRIDPRGNQSGTDADGNAWNYNARAKTYYNYGTGKMCTGEGAARVCN